MRIGITELIVIALVAVALFKPERLKDYVQMAKSASDTFKDTKEQLTSEAKDIIEPVVEVRDEIKGAA